MSQLVGYNRPFGRTNMKLMITTVDLVSDTNIFYKSWHESDKDFSMLELVYRSFGWYDNGETVEGLIKCWIFLIHRKVDWLEHKV